MWIVKLWWTRPGTIWSFFSYSILPSHLNAFWFGCVCVFERTGYKQPYPKARPRLSSLWADHISGSAHLKRYANHWVHRASTKLEKFKARRTLLVRRMRWVAAFQTQQLNLYPGLFAFAFAQYHAVRPSSRTKFRKLRLCTCAYLYRAHMGVSELLGQVSRAHGGFSHCVAFQPFMGGSRVKNIIQWPLALHGNWKWTVRDGLGMPHGPWATVNCSHTITPLCFSW